MHELKASVVLTESELRVIDEATRAVVRGGRAIPLPWRVVSSARRKIVAALDRVGSGERLSGGGNAA